MDKEIKWILVKSLLLVSIFFGFQRVGHAQNAPVITAGSVMNAVAGQQITIPITTSAFRNIGSMSLSLDYDPTKLQFVSATLNPLLAGNFNVGNTPISVDKNRLVMGWYNLNGVSLPDGSIIVNYVFTYLSGSPTLQWFEDGPSCDFTDPLANKLNDTPSSTYYNNGMVCGALPNTIAINGSNNVCIGQTGIVYSVPLDPTITYNWSYSGTGATISGTSNTVQIDFSPSATSGTLTVTASNACSTSTGSKDIILNSLLTPTFTTGPTNVQYRSIGNIYTTESGKSNYIWTATGGTITAGGTILDNSATITWNSVGAQSVSVKYDDQTHCTPATPTMYPVTVNPAVISITGITANKVYDGTNNVSLNNSSAMLVDVIGQDILTLNSIGASGIFTDKNVGTGKQVTTSGFTLGGADAGNYTLIQPTITADITPLYLTISGVTANSKTYDGNNTTTLNIGSAAMSGILNLDQVTLNSSNATGIFSDMNVGSRKTVITSGFSITGTDAANYSLIQPISIANISPAQLTISGVTASNKVYDGTTVASLNTVSATLAGVISPDNVTLSKTGVTGTFSDKPAANGKTVTTSGFTLGGINAGNYIVNQPVTTASIIPATLTITGLTANKVYDGTFATTLNTSLVALNGALASDIVILNSTGASAAFVDKNVGTGKIVNTSGFSLSGTNAGNYVVISPVIAGNITPAILTISGISANNKNYDGTSTATLNTTSASLTGIFGADIVTLSTSGATGIFASKNVASNILVNTSGFTLGGANAANYTLIQPVISAGIIPANLTITGLTTNKVYDGILSTILNTSSAILVGVIAPDNVFLNATGASATFADKNVGTRKIVNTTGFTLSGTHASNYVVTSPVITGDITPATLTISGIVADNKNYDGTKVANLNTTQATMAGLNPVDVVILNKSNGTGTFANKNTGNGITITTSGFSISGASAGNYTLIQPILSANILPFASPLTITGVAASTKTYDGTPTAILNTDSAMLTGMISTDIVTLNVQNATGNFVDKKAAKGKQITTAGFKLEGIDAINYTLSQPTLTADIKASTITVSGITAENKIFDGTTLTTLNTSTAVLVGAVSTDDIKLMSTAANGTFADKNIGSGKIVTPTGLSVTGLDAANYSLTNPILTANITPKSLKITANNVTKCLGLTHIFTGDTFTTEGLVNNDTVKSVLLSSNGVDPTAIAGTYDIVPENAGGTGLSNYAITYVKGTLTVIPLAKQPSEFMISTSTVCKGATGVAYTIPKDPLVTYNWSYSGTGAIIHGNTNTVTLDYLPAATSGILSVIAATSCGTSIARTLAITINVLKTKPEIVYADKILSSNFTEGNQWYKDMILIPGATGQYYTPTVNGKYFNVISNNNCSSDTSNFVNVIITNTTQYMNNTIQIFPNPAKEYFTIRSTNTMSETIKLSIFSSDCILIKNFEISNKSVKRESLIDVRNLSSGLYFIRIDTGQKTITQKLIIL